MAKIAFRQSAKMSLSLAAGEEPTNALLSDAEYSAHLQSVLELYAVCLAQVVRLRAALMDGREHDARILRTHCREILEALDADLDRSVELAENFHLLYQHCLRHLGEDALPFVEDVDAVQMVVSRLRRLYVHLAHEES